MNMRKYFATLHTKPDHHKRRFAFLASSAITLSIFGIWSLVTFGIVNTEKESAIAGIRSSTVALSEVAKPKKETEVSPFQSLRMNLAASLEAFKRGLGEMGTAFEAIDFESEYKELRDGALDAYGK